MFRCFRKLECYQHTCVSACLCLVLSLVDYPIDNDFNETTVSPQVISVVNPLNLSPVSVFLTKQTYLCQSNLMGFLDIFQVY